MIIFLKMLRCMEDEQGRLVKLEMGLPSANIRELADAVLNEKIHLIAMGKWAIRDGKVVRKGAYE